NAWLNEFSDRDDFTIIRYESLREFPGENFRILLAVLGETRPDVSIFQAALDFSEFENMKKWRQPALLTQKYCGPATCAIRSRSKCVAERLGVIASIFRLRIKNMRPVR